MQWRHWALLVAILAATPALGQEGESGGGGADDPPGDDNGGGGGDDPPGDDGGGGGGGDGSWVRARSLLMRDAASPDGDARGHVEVRARGDRQRFQVEAELLDPGLSVEFLVEDGAAAMVSAGFFTANAAGQAEAELDTGDGGALPAGAATVAELAGRRVDVRDAEGALLLSGTVPSLDAAPIRLRGRTRVRDEVTGVRVDVEMRVSGPMGRQQFRIKVRRAEPNAALELWIDDGAGTLVLAAEMTANPGGSVAVRLDSRRGDGMPLGAGGVQDLSGRPFEVRVGGVAVAAGALPTL